MAKESGKHDSPGHGNLVVSVTTLSGTSTGHFREEETLQEVIDWVVSKQNLVINGPMVLTYNDRALNPAHTLEQEQLPHRTKLTYIAVVSGGGRHRA